MCSQNSSTGSHTERRYSNAHLRTLFPNTDCFPPVDAQICQMICRLQMYGLNFSYLSQFTMHATTSTHIFVYLINLHNDEILQIFPVPKSSQDIHSSRYTDQLPSKRTTPYPLSAKFYSKYSQLTYLLTYSMVQSPS